MCVKTTQMRLRSKTVYWVCRQRCNVEFQLRLNITANRNKEIKAVSITVNVTQRLHLLKRRSSRTRWKTRVGQQKPNIAHVMCCVSECGREEVQDAGSQRFSQELKTSTSPGQAK